MTPRTEDLLKVILPCRQESLMLRASLSRSKEARRTWTEWQQLGDGPAGLLAANSAGVKRLLPALWPSLQEAEVNIPADVRNCLCAAYMREEIRSETYQGICRRAFESLTLTGVSFLILNGASLAEHEYGDPALRHCHDCDLLIHTEDTPRAIDALVTGEFVLEPASRRDHGDTIFRHPSGLPILLHQSLFPSPYYRPPLEDVWARSTERQICGFSGRVLSPADSLLHVLGLASCSSSRSTLLWVIDACLIMRAHSDLDWDVFVSTAIRSRLELPLSVMLGYLATEQNAEVPVEVRRKIKNAAGKTDATGYQAALFGAAAATHSDIVVELFRHARTWTQRCILLRWLILPSPVHLQWRYGLKHRWQVFLLYLVRPIRGLVHRVLLRLNTPRLH